MNKFKITTLAAILAVFSFYSCDQDSVVKADEINQEVLDILTANGYDIQNIAPIHFEDGYLVEGDIYITTSDLKNLQEGTPIANLEQYHTTELVCPGGGRTINVYMDEGGSGGGGNGGGKGGGKPKNSSASFPSTYGQALNEAISRFNGENLLLTFQRVTSTGDADIVFTRLGKRDERRGILGSAGFPSSCNPYNEIKMSGILESTYGLSINGIATIMAHEMGHCIGFRHTDYFNRSISCGSGGNEGDAGIGAIHIPGTPTGADLQGNGSWMLACTDGSDRPFTSADRTALDYLY